MNPLTFDIIYEQAARLPNDEKLRLISKLADGMHHGAKSTSQAETVETSNQAEQSETESRHSLRGLWTGVRISDEDIEEARREMWGNFPREDI